MMTAQSHSFKRLVVGIRPKPADPSIRFAVELADLLRLDLLGLFLEETAVHDLAAIPFAREFRPLEGGWHPIDTGQLAREFELAALTSERLFRQAVKRLSTDCRFEVVRGPTIDSLIGISRSDDIIVIIEPVDPAERATQQFLWQLEAAFRSAAAVLLLPPRMDRRVGPVVAITAMADDPAIPAAAAIASAAREQLVIATTSGDAMHLLGQGTAATFDTRQIMIDRAALTGAPALSRALPVLGERLLVVSRGLITDEAALSLASLRRAPLLVIEPGEFGASSGSSPKRNAA